MMWQENGFTDADAELPVTRKRLSTYVDSLPAQFKKQDPAWLLQPLQPGKWSGQQVLGHLIDSALNNLKRVTEIPFAATPYEVIAYSQDNLVAVNRYNSLPPDHFLHLWQALNRQIIYVVNGLDETALATPIKPQYANRQQRTLAWLINDYVAHLEHHLQQPAF